MCVCVKLCRDGDASQVFDVTLMVHVIMVQIFPVNYFGLLIIVSAPSSPRQVELKHSREQHPCMHGICIPHTDGSVSFACECQDSWDSM